MISSFDIESLEKILKDFYTIMKIRISIFDDEFKPIIEYPERAAAFCENIRIIKEGMNACRKCDHEACERANELRKSHIYTCHAGITEAITPIQIGGGIIGYAILAQMLPLDNYDEAFKNACELAGKYGVPIKQSEVALKKMEKRTDEQINAGVKIIEALSSYIYIQNLAVWKNEDLSLTIDKYIRSNLNKELNSELICKQFHCSRSYLYNLSMKEYGVGISQYICNLKIEEAKRMLKENLSINEISEKLGFSNYNYFSRVFKNKMGLSPLKYKQSIQ